MTGNDAARTLLDRMTDTPASWLSKGGEHPGIVLSSRVRLARNLNGFPFGNRASEVERQRVVDEACRSAHTTAGLGRGVYLDVSKITTLDRQLLLERHLISRDLAGDEGARGVLVEPDEALSILVNEEDHLRLQAITSGYQLQAAWEQVDALDSELARSLGFAYSEQWGFLTACPTNAGTGMRASVLIHLPALVLTKQISKVLQGIAQVGLAVRGLHGEGTEVMGNFFQVSNQATLGLTEAEILEGLTRVTRQLIGHERAAAEVLLRDARPEIEDKVFRALGILRSCRVIASEEVMSLASAVRLGVEFGIIDSVSIEALNRILILTQPAHVERAIGAGAPPTERDQRRAGLVRAQMTAPPG